MPTYSFECPNGHEYEKVLKIEDRETKTRCSQCKRVGKRLIAPSSREPSFTEKLYGTGGYYDPNLDEHIRSPQHRKEVMDRLGVTECQKDRSTKRHQEAYLMKHRANSRFLNFYKR